MFSSVHYCQSQDENDKADLKGKKNCAILDCSLDKKSLSLINKLLNEAEMDMSMLYIKPGDKVNF